jgi:hypothetical protein
MSSRKPAKWYAEAVNQSAELNIVQYYESTARIEGNLEPKTD